MPIFIWFIDWLPNLWACEVLHKNVYIVIYATADEADVYIFHRCLFLFSVFCFFPSVKKIPDNRSRERLNGFSWNIYQTIAGKM